MQNFTLSRDDIFQNIEFFKQNSEQDYCKTIRNIISSAPFGKRKFYIHSFVKRVDDTSGVKKMYHHPRLTKPEPLPGGTLMRVDPDDIDKVTILWTLPNHENFGLYKEGKMFSEPFVSECVKKFLENPNILMQKEEGDPSDHEIRNIYREIKEKLKRKKEISNIAQHFANFKTTG
jgi:hypothetical protein